MNIFALARYRAGIALDDAARLSGVSMRQISRIEANEIKKPSAPIVKALADTYGTTVDVLLGVDLEEAA